MIRMIAAVDDRLGIADAEGIPWDVPTDRRYFREHTAGHIIVMGYATYLEFKKPLEGRQNVVIDERNAGVREGFVAVSDTGGFLHSIDKDVWVIGGARLFAKTLSLADELYLTHIEGDYGCTKFFPRFSEDFVLQDKSNKQSENGYSYYFARYVRIYK